MSSYPDNINPCAFRLLSEILASQADCRSFRILEFGCSTGALGAEVIRRFPGIHWSGLDISQDALLIAKSRIPLAIQVDLNLITEEELMSIEKAPDVLVMIDVLEHVYDPYRLLGIIASAYRTTKVVCILPNIACYQTYDQISIGDFKYHEFGIFDRTHRTFFTPKSALDLFKEYGYLCDTGPLFLPDPVTSSLLSQDLAFPFEFKRGSYSISISDRDMLINVCSYGFGFIASRPA
jgi:SAM-dependent methyltransferase